MVVLIPLLFITSLLLISYLYRIGSLARNKADNLLLRAGSYKQLKSEIKELEQQCEKGDMFTLENYPTYSISPYQTKPKVKFVPLFNPKFIWNKHY